MYALSSTLILLMLLNFDLYGQTHDTLDLYERKFTEFLERTGQKRLDVDGFILYSNSDSLPQDVFFIPRDLESYNSRKTLEENFFDLISQPDSRATEEVFMPIRWTMPNLMEELQKCTSFVVESDYPPVFGGWPMRVIYGRIVYRIFFPNEERVIAPPMVSSITLRHKMKEYKISIGKSDYGNAKLFRALK